MGIFSTLLGTDPDPFGVFGTDGKLDPLTYLKGKPGEYKGGSGQLPDSAGLPYNYTQGQRVTPELVQQVYQYVKGRAPSQYEINYYTNEKNKDRTRNRREQFWNDLANKPPSSLQGKIHTKQNKGGIPYTGMVTPVDQRQGLSGAMPRGAGQGMRGPATGQGLGGPLGQPANLSALYGNAGPMMQQALGLAGQSRPPVQKGIGAPPPMHVAPPRPGQFQISPNELMSRQWLSALNGRM